MERADRERWMDMAKRRAHAGSGSDLWALRETRSRYGVKDLLPDLPGLAYAIVGGLATARYMPERMTLDTDILVSAEDRKKAEEILDQAGCSRIGPLTIGGSTWRMPKDRCLDVIAPDRPWVVDAIATAERDEGGYPFIALPYLVLMKMESGRMQDLADVGRMLGFAEPEPLDAVRAVVARFLPQDTEDLESLIRLGKLEHAP